MHPLMYLFIAFLFIWIVVFYYLIRLFRRQKVLLEELNRLKGILGEYRDREEQIKLDQQR